MSLRANDHMKQVIFIVVMVETGRNISRMGKIMKTCYGVLLLL